MLGGKLLFKAMTLLMKQLVVVVEQVVLLLKNTQDMVPGKVE